MHILRSDTSTQTIKFYPRNQTYSTVDIEFFDKQKAKAFTKTDYTVTYTHDLASITFVDTDDDLKDGRFYSFSLKNGSATIYKGLIFCTDQTPSDYTINKDVYTEHTSDNDFIVL